MKKALSLIAAIIFAISVSGCYIGSDGKLRRKEHKQAVQVFKYLKKEDISALSKLFAERTDDQCDLEEEWEVFFDEVDGRIVSYDDLQVSVIERWDDHWKITRALLQVTFRNVKTDEGVVYDEIVYDDYAIHSDPDCEGIIVVSLGKDIVVVGGADL